MDFKNIVNNYKEKIFFFILVSIISLVFTKYYFLYTHEYYPPAQSDLIANFEADKVFQKRFLIPVITNTFSNTLDISFDHSLKFFILVLTIALIYGFKEMLNLFNTNDTIQYLSIFILVPVFWNYAVLNSIFHAYDIPAMSFFCWGVVLFIKNKFFLFYILFSFATLNRESTCFITISILLLQIDKFSKMKNNKFLIKHVFYQFIIWVGLVYSVKYLIKDNPGSFYEETFSIIHFFECMLRNDACWPFLSPNSFFSNPRCFLTLFFGLWIFIPIFWRFNSPSSKKLLLLIPVYLIPCVLYANLMETRVYHELNIVISLFSVLGFYNFLFTNYYYRELDYS